jgi:Family of unknown function (DUF6188)
VLLAAGRWIARGWCGAMLSDVRSGHAEPQELDDRWLLGWRGLRVEQLRVDYRLVLMLGQACELAVEQPGVVAVGGVRSPDARPVSVVPQTGDVAAALPLLHTTVLSSIAFKTGTLRVVFDSGHHLEVHPSADYEAWTAAGPGTAKWVCLPGGALAVWL